MAIRTPRRGLAKAIHFIRRLKLSKKSTLRDLGHAKASIVRQKEAVLEKLPPKVAVRVRRAKRALADRRLEMSEIKARQAARKNSPRPPRFP